MKPKASVSQGSALVVTAAALWALDGILRRSLYVLPPLTIVFFEVLIGFVILLPFTWRSLHLGRIDRQTWVVSAAIGLFSGLLGTLLFTAALQQVNYIPFSVVLLIQKLQPIFAGLAAYFLLKERLTTKYVLWAALALAAGFFVTFPNGFVNLAQGSGQLWAAALALSAAVCWGGSTALSKLLLHRQSEGQATTLRFGWTVVWAIVAAIIFGRVQHLQLLNLSQLATLVAIALSTGMVAVYVYYRGLKTTPVLVATILELTFPVLAVFIDIFLYHTVLAPTQYLAAIIMLVCLYQVSRSHIAPTV